MTGDEPQWIVVWDDDQLFRYDSEEDARRFAETAAADGAEVCLTRVVAVCSPGPIVRKTVWKNVKTAKAKGGGR